MRQAWIVVQADTEEEALGRLRDGDHTVWLDEFSATEMAKLSRPSGAQFVLKVTASHWYGRAP